LVELCASNYATFDGIVNGVDDIFKASTTYCEKTIIWIMFQNFKIGTLTREKYNHYYDNNIESNCNNKNHSSFLRIIIR
jgi:phosphopantetheine adenylyltransferase